MFVLIQQKRIEQKHPWKCLWFFLTIIIIISLALFLKWATSKDAGSQGMEVKQLIN